MSPDGLLPDADSNLWSANPSPKAFASRIEGCLQHPRTIVIEDEGGMRLSRLVEIAPGQLAILDDSGNAVSRDEVSEAARDFGLDESPLPRAIRIKIESASDPTRFCARALVRIGANEIELSSNSNLEAGFVVVDRCVIHLANHAALAALLKEEPRLFHDDLDLFSCLSILRAKRLDATLPDIEMIDVADDDSLELDWMDHSTGLLPSIVPYEYQARGIHWVRSRFARGIGGLLADEMGLGKTPQAISGIALVVEGGGRCLIVVPNALSENWRRELLKFAGIEAFVYVRESATVPPSVLASSSVVITTYDTVRTHELILREVQWTAIVLDEAQYIKNPDAQRTRSVKALPRRMGLALTGTPVENRPSDIVSILDFVVPQGFDDLARKGANLTVEEAQLALDPYLPRLMLRRRVAEVGVHLPPRQDISVPLVGSDWFYSEHAKLVDSASNQSSRGQQLAIITKLRQLGGQEDPSSSPKVEFLLSVLEGAPVGRQKTLVFASFNATIEMIAEVCRSKGFVAYTITGATEDRQQVVDAFSRVEGPAVLVMNPRAGGVGLNITAAATVVHFEPEWNPAVIDQASARSFRTGQTQNFFAYYLTVSNSIDEYMATRVEQKRAVADELIASVDDDLSDEQIKELLKWLQGNKP